MNPQETRLDPLSTIAAGCKAVTMPTPLQRMID
jgi:hypothetical protein